MLQINAPALSQFTLGPKSRHEVPIPESTTNGTDEADNPANGTETIKIQRLEGMTNQRSESVALQLIADPRNWVLFWPFLDSLNTKFDS
jgi:hypothetical protein